MPDQLNITNIPSNRIEFIDPRTGLVSREWYRFFLNLFNLAGAGSNQISLDELQIGPPPMESTGSGGGGGSGTVTSVDVSGGTTGLTTSGGPITSSGTITMAGTLNVTNGGTGATTAAGAPFALKGANADITSMSGVTGGISTPDYIDFDTTAAPARATGRLWWDNADGIQTLNLGMAGSNATMQIGEEMYFRIKASAAITEGQVVMFTGTVGASGALQGAPATGLTATTAQYVMGVATESIAHNGWGYVTQFGLVRGIDTSGGAEAWADGDILYYDPTVVGGLTKTLPSAPNAKVVVAAVIYASASNGSLFVRPSFGGELGQYEGNVGFGTLSNGDLMQYDSGAGKWTNVPSSTFGTGSVTSVGTAGTVNGLTLTGGPITTSGTVTLGGTLDLSSPPTIGNTTPAAGTFTTLTATGQTSLGGAAGSESLRVTPVASAVNWVEVLGDSSVYPSIKSAGAGSALELRLSSKGGGSLGFLTNNLAQRQMQVTHTASAVNYVQVTGAATGGKPTLSAQGSDTNATLLLTGKGTGAVDTAFYHRIGASYANWVQISGAASGSNPSISSLGSDTNIDLTLTPKGTGVVRTSGTGIRLYGSTSGYVGLKGAAAAGSTTYTLPAVDGTTGQMLSTNGSGTLSWATGGGNITAQGLWENNKTISSNYSVTSGNNALSAGPITVASGVVVTVPSGSVWTII